jgi:predicted metal-binding membrane protein
VHSNPTTIDTTTTNIFIDVYIHTSELHQLARLKAMKDKNNQLITNTTTTKTINGQQQQQQRQQQQQQQGCYCVLCCFRLMLCVVVYVG